jgi:hypothetical protein
MRVRRKREERRKRKMERKNEEQDIPISSDKQGNEFIVSYRFEAATHY